MAIPHLSLPLFGRLKVSIHAFYSTLLNFPNYNYGVKHLISYSRPLVGVAFGGTHLIQEGPFEEKNEQHINWGKCMRNTLLQVSSTAPKREQLWGLQVYLGAEFL